MSHFSTLKYAIPLIERHNHIALYELVTHINEIKATNMCTDPTLLNLADLTKFRSRMIQFSQSSSSIAV